RLLNDEWEPARIIYDPGPDAQTIANQIVVLPDGTLVNMFMQINAMSTPEPARYVAIQRSTDKGITWSSPVIISQSQTVGVGDLKSLRRVRSGALIPGIAVDPQSGKLYVVWQDSRFSAGARDGIALSTSIDGGRTWTPPTMVNPVGNTPAFTPAIAVSNDGNVGVSYYDFRFDDTGNNSSLMTS